MGGNTEIKTVNIYVGFFFMVNFVLGTGFLGLPFSFFHGGLIAGACTLLVVGFMTWQSALYEVETMGRAQEMWDLRHPQDSDDTSKASNDESPKYQVTIERKFEPSELCEVFVGKWLKVVYLVILAIYCFLACLSYSTVFGAAWSVNIPFNFGSSHQCKGTDFLHHTFPHNHHCLNAYRFCLAIFALLVIPLSLFDLKEQQIVQFILGVLRFGTLGAIILYCFVNSVMGGVVDMPFNSTIDFIDILPANQTINDSFPMIDVLDDAPNVTSLVEIVTHFNFKGWVMGIPVIVYAFILHQGIPGLTHPIKEKHWLKRYFNILFLTITSLYLVLGIVGSLWFRDAVNETVTLNFGPLTKRHHNMALRILSYYIILFPSLDVYSVYPLVVHTIVNNIYTVVFGRDTSQDAGSFKRLLVQKLMKFVVGFLPIVIALFVSNLVSVLNFAGLAGFFIVLFFPIVFQLSSQWVCYKQFRSTVQREEKSKSAIGNLEKDSSVTKSIGKNDVDKMLGKEEYSVQSGSEDEKTSLLGGGPNRASIVEFFFSFKAQNVARTPYSTALSHPLIVVIVAFFASACFFLSVYSVILTVAHKHKHTK